MASVLALAPGTILAEEYRIERVLGMGGFGITYLATELLMDRHVTVKEYFPVEFATRIDGTEAVPRSEGSREDFQWGLDRFIEEARALVQFNHPSINRFYRHFRANGTGYIVLHFEEGDSLKTWLKALGRAPRQKELDGIVAPLLDALEHIHAADYLHRDIAPDNIIVRRNGTPVLIDFGSARGDIAKRTRTLSALVKPGYSPYEQYSETGHRQGPPTDIYAFAATLYHAVSGKRPPDAPSRVVKDDYQPAKDVALASYRTGFLKAIDWGLELEPERRPRSIQAWRARLLAPEPAATPAPSLWARRGGDPVDAPAAAAEAAAKASAETPASPQVAGKGPPGGAPAAAAAAMAAPAVAAMAKNRPAPTPPAPVVAKAPVGAQMVVPAAKPPKKPVAKPAPQIAIAGEPTLSRLLRAARKAPRPRPIRNPARGRLGSVVVKLGIGAAFAAGLLMLQSQLPAIVTSSTSVPSSQSSGSSGELLLLGQLKGHSGGTSAVAYSDDGRTMVTVGIDNQLKIWSVAANALMKSVAFGGGSATTIAISGRRAATGHQDGRVIIWDIDRAEIVATLRRNEAPIWSVAFAGDSNRVLAASHDYSVVYWDIKSAGQPLHVFEGHESAAQSVAYTPTSGVIASGGADRTVRLWNAASLSAGRVLKGHRDYVVSLTFSPDGRMLASGSLDGTIRLWSPATGNTIRTLAGHKGRVSGLAFNPAGDLLASSGDDGTLRLWEVKRGRSVRVYGGGGPAVKGLAFTPDGKRVAAASDDGTVRVWLGTAPATKRQRHDDDDDG